MNFQKKLLTMVCTLAALSASAQSMTFAEVTGTGAKPLSATELKELVSGAKAEMTMPKGAQRRWTNLPDGTFQASRTNGDLKRRNGSGTWSVKEDATYCLNFDWGSMDTESRCTTLYKVDSKYLAFGPDPKPEAPSSQFEFSR